ncbi:MAG TPA: hypothetical protein VJ672_11825 [Gemmatimonadaceae bacterium]|nr:hypothetical protein [Gemmatimonadaceae bacterium]
MGEALRGDAEARRRRRRPRASLLVVIALIALLGRAAWAQSGAPLRLDGGRFTFLYHPSEAQLARSLLASAVRRDTFPGLPRPNRHVVVALAPDERRFRQWIGPYAPEWGSAIAFPGEHRIVMQGRRAGSDAGDPVQVLRHELAHLALHENLGDLPPRWFDEGYASYAAGEWSRDEVLTTSVSLLIHGLPPLDSLESGFNAGSMRAQAAYALGYRAVAELAALDSERGLALLFDYWKRERSLDRAIRLAYGLTLVGFEARWKQRTMRRFGALALLANVSLAAGIVALIVVPLYITRRRRLRARLQALRASEEAAERAAKESALQELLKGAAAPPVLPNDTSPEPPDGAPPAADDSRTSPH